MRARLTMAALAALIVSLFAGAADAGPSMCDIQEKLGVRNVRECEDATS